MSTTLLLAYDQSIEDYEGMDFRDIIVEFLLEKEERCILRSPVSSTIYITTNKRRPLENWSELLRNRFPRRFWFSLAVVHSVNDQDLIEERVKRSIQTEFNDIVIATRIILYG